MSGENRMALLRLYLRVLDLLGKEVPPDLDGLIVTGTFELRLSDGYGQHYVLLKGELEHVERL